MAPSNCRGLGKLGAERDYLGQSASSGPTCVLPCAQPPSCHPPLGTGCSPQFLGQQEQLVSPTERC